MPKPKDILLFWAEKLIFEYNKESLDAFYDYDKSVLSICFACGTSAGTQRCHIVPKHFGGGDNLENLHLLCNECHLESEGLTSKDIYFEWFSKKDSTNSGSFQRLKNLSIFYAKLIVEGKSHLVPKYIMDVIKSKQQKPQTKR